MGAADRRTYYARTAGLAAASTLVITASFVGVLSLVQGEFAAIGGRIPYYLVGTAVIFLGMIFVLEEHNADGREIIAIASIFSVLGFVLIVLSVEGVRFAYTNPGEVFVSRLVLYFLAAALLGTGIAYWGLHHWREFTGRAAEQL